MAVFNYLKNIFRNSSSEGLTFEVNLANEELLSEKVSKEQASGVDSLKLTGKLDADDITWLHKAFKELVELDLSGVTIRGGRFVCGMHSNYYDIANNQMSRHSLHIGHLEKVVLPATMESIELSGYSDLGFGGIGDTNELTRMSGAFAREVKSIEVPAENKFFSSFDGILYNKEQTELLKCPISHGPELTFPTTLKKIRENAFRECANLTSVTLPEGVEEVGNYTFFECRSLRELILPSTVRVLGENVFAHCTRLGMLEMESAVPPELNLTRSSNLSDCHLIVPAEALTAYEEAQYWSGFKKITAKQ